MSAALRPFLILSLSAALFPFSSLAQTGAAPSAEDYPERLRREAGIIPGPEYGELFDAIVRLKVSHSDLDEYEATIAVREALAVLIEAAGPSAAAIVNCDQLPPSLWPRPMPRPH
jgi:hypothetical protein